MERAFDTRLVVGPNASLKGSQAALFFGSICVVSLAIAGAFAVQGYWPILPFAGLKLAALGAALWVCLRRNRYREVIDVFPASVRVAAGMIGRGPQLEVEFPRRGTRVFLEAAAEGRPALWMQCGGQRLEIGCCLTDPERVSLCARLKELLHPGFGAGGGGPESRVRENA